MLGQKLLRSTTSPSSLRDATSPSRGGFGSPRKVNGFARGSPTRGAVERSETERLYEGKPDRRAKGSPFGRAGERSETERASPGQESFCAAISRFFVRAILSLCFYISVSILALSVIASQCHCPGCGSQRLLRYRSHPAGRCPNSSSLFPPLAAVVAVAPKGRGFHAVERAQKAPRSAAGGFLRPLFYLPGLQKSGYQSRIITYVS